MAEEKENSLTLEHASASYGVRSHTRKALSDVSLSITKGELVAILGPNGAGKSTLLRVMAGLLTATGAVRLFDNDMTSIGREAAARLVSVVPQESDIAYGFSVREVVAMGRAPHQSGWMRASERDEAVVDAAIRDCDLEALEQRSARELSGGEKKRVAIARALAQQTPALVLDEPTASLDVKHQLALMDLLLARIAKGLLCVIAMHDLNLAAQYATRVVLMKDSQVVADGTPADVMTWARLKETFGADLYVGLNDLTGAPFFLPMKR